jgi:hypothetical protein
MAVHVAGRFDAWLLRISISRKMELQRSIVAEAKPFPRNMRHDCCAGRWTCAANFDLIAGLGELPKTLFIEMQVTARLVVPEE